MTTFFEALPVGQQITLGSHTFEADGIVRFARAYDPQPFHLSEETARSSLFGALCASGWHTASAFMRLNIDYGRERMIEAMDWQGPAPVFGPSPGIRDLAWLRPVFAGDTVTYTNTITDKRRSDSKPGWGILTARTDGANQNGHAVIRFTSAVLIRAD